MEQSRREPAHLEVNATAWLPLVIDAGSLVANQPSMLVIVTRGGGAFRERFGLRPEGCLAPRSVVGIEPFQPSSSHAHGSPARSPLADGRRRD